MKIRHRDFRPTDPDTTVENRNQRHIRLLEEARSCFDFAKIPLSSLEVANMLGIKQTHARSLINKLVEAGVLRQTRDAIRDVPSRFCNSRTRKQRSSQWEILSGE